MAIWRTPFAIIPTGAFPADYQSQLDQLLSRYVSWWRMPAPVRRGDGTVTGDGWTLNVAPAWVVREGARRGDYELIRQP